ncbi:nuclear transport factor 2 family protein [Glycomyces tarimensis]
MRMPKAAKIAIAGVVAAVAMTGGVAVASADESAGVQDEATTRERDQAAFDEIRRQQEQAWIDQDGAAFAATFSEDADVVTFSGDHLSTRDEIAEGMQYYFDNYIVDSRLNMISEHVRYVERDVVVIVRTGCIINEGESECREDSYSTNTNVLTRERGRWLQTSFQNTRRFDF